MRTQAVLSVNTEPSLAGADQGPDRYGPPLHEPLAGEAASNPLLALRHAGENHLDERLA